MMNIIKEYHNFKTRMLLKQQIRQNRAGLRIVVGSGDIFETGWIPTEINSLNLLKRQDWDALFPPNEIHAILAACLGTLNA